MAAYFPVFRVQIKHGFFADGTCRNLELSPDPETAELMRQHQLLLRSEPGGFALYRSNPLGAVAGSEVHVLRFLLFSTDPEFQLYTAGFDKTTRQPLYCTNELMDGQRLLVQELPVGLWRSVAKTNEMKLPPGHKKALLQPCLVVDIKVPEVDLVESPATVDEAVGAYLVTLDAARIYWKYYFFGEFARKAIEISDLNAAHEGIGFESSVMPVAHSGAAFVSTVAIPMQEVPTQRFQLREKEEAGRVLIKRLPNAGTRKIGKEKLRDGGEVLVAEIYINQ